jgi:hypothetical protein
VCTSGRAFVVVHNIVCGWVLVVCFTAACNSLFTVLVGFDGGLFLRRRLVFTICNLQRVKLGAAEEKEDATHKSAAVAVAPTPAASLPPPHHWRGGGRVIGVRGHPLASSSTPPFCQDALQTLGPITCGVCVYEVRVLSMCMVSYVYVYEYVYSG